MEKKYCKICGLELERGKCSSGAHIIENIKDKTKCTSCKKVIDADSKFCPYCGLPINGILNNGKLKSELEGKYVEDVIEHYGIKKSKKDKKTSKAPFIILCFVIIVGVALLIVKKTSLLSSSPVEMLAEKEIIETVESQDDKSKNDIEKQEETERGKADIEQTTIEPTSKASSDESSLKEPTASTRQTINLSNGGTIKNQDKTKDFYIDDLIEIIDIKNNDGKECEITYYLPIFKGKDANATNEINDIINKTFYNELKTMINKHVDELKNYPKEVFIDTVEAKVNNKGITIIINGSTTPYDEGLYGKCKFRILYNKKSNTCEVRDITE